MDIGVELSVTGILGASNLFQLLDNVNRVALERLSQEGGHGRIPGDVVVVKKGCHRLNCRFGGSLVEGDRIEAFDNIVIRYIDALSGGKIRTPSRNRTCDGNVCQRGYRG